MTPVGQNLRQLLTGLSDRQFEQLYGVVEPLEPPEAQALLADFEPPWWIVGGWAIQAFTGVQRPHEDLDVCILARDVPRLVEHFLGTHHVWATGAGMLCPVLAVEQELPSWLHQLWVRHDASSPWLLDFIVTPDRGGKWIFQREPSYVDELERVTWLADDGITYQKPEITLAFKAALDRDKDWHDLNSTVPLLDPPARSWLADTVARLYPDHDWLPLLDSTG